jgi:hypothetical protein
MYTRHKSIHCGSRSQWQVFDGHQYFRVGEAAHCERIVIE